MDSKADKETPDEQSTDSGASAEGAGRGSALFADILPVCATIAIAAAFRVYAAVTAACINRDGQEYLSMAREGIERGLRPMIADALYHPLYAILIVPFVKLSGGDFESAGRAASIVFGVAAIVPIYYLAVDVTRKRPVAYFAALVYAVSPYIVRVESAVYSEGVYIFFLVSAAWLGYRSLSEVKVLYGAGAGICVALAYLARPEGLVMGLVLGVAFAVVSVRSLAAEGVSEKSLRKITSGAACLCAFVVLFMPYVFVLHKRDPQHRWMLSPKFTRLSIGGDPASAGVERAGVLFPSSLEKYNKEPEITGEQGQNIYLGAAFEAGNEFVITSFYPFMLLIVIGAAFWRRIGFSTGGLLFLAGFVVADLAAAFSRASMLGYLAHRHVVPLTAITCIFAGAGVVEVVRFGEKRLWRRFQIRPESVFAIFAVIIILFAAPKALKRTDVDSAVARNAGEWIAANCDLAADETIITAEPRVAFYAGRNYYFMETESYDNFRRFLSDPMSKPRIVVIEEGPKDFLGIIRDGRYEGLRLAAVFESKSGKRKLHVFRVNYQRE